jgi:serine/threonine protein kinase
MMGHFAPNAERRKNNMKVVVKGKGIQTLNKTDFLAAGGEGSVYAKSGVAYKIYNDPKKMIPEGKIHELSVFTEPNIIRPLDVLLDEQSNSPIGYTMRYLTDTYALCQTFNKIFKQRNSLTVQHIFDLVQKMQKGVQHIHDNNSLIVDCNEMNFLVNQKFDEVYFIDVDSYQTPNYKATAIMESIRDRQVTNNAFTKYSDWFSWGVITFQMFIGIHPYKGRHTSVNNMNERMLQNLSVFNPNVGMPAVCEPFDVIPQNYREWYKAVFEDGKRLAPPTGAVAVITLTTHVDKIIGSNKFEIKEMQDFSELGDITNVYFHFGTRVVQQERGIVIGDSIDKKVSPDAKIGFTPQLNHVVTAKIARGGLSLYNASTGKVITEQPAGGNVMSYDGNLYVKDGDSVYLLSFVEMPLQTRGSIKLVATVLDKATQVFDGVMIQNLLGSSYVSLFPTAKTHYQIRVKEIEKYRIVDAKFDHGVLMVVGVDSSGRYDRFVFRFAADYATYDVRKEEDIAYVGLNFVVLDTGVCVHIDEDERVNLFRAAKDHKQLTIIEDPAIKSDMRLHRWGAQIVVSRGHKLYTLKMK